MKYSELPTAVRIVYMYCFIIAASYVFLGLSLTIYLSAIDSIVSVSAIAPAALIKLSYSWYSDSYPRFTLMPFIPILVVPSASIGVFYNLPIEAENAPNLMVIWPAINAVLLYLLSIILFQQLRNKSKNEL